MLIPTSVALAATVLFADPAPHKVILDTDIGDDIDDAYALAMLVADPSAKLLGVTTAFGETDRRAELAAKLLKVAGRGDVPVCAGRETKREPGRLGRQCEWSKGFRSRSMKKEPAVEFLRKTIESSPGEVTIIAIGPLTNLGDLFRQHPEVKAKLRGIAIMGGALAYGYNSEAPAVPEYNIVMDPAAARLVFDSGVPLVMAGLDATAMLRFDAEHQKRLFALGAPVTDALAALTNLWGNNTPVLFDCMAVAHALGHEFCEVEPHRMVVEDNGLTRAVPGTPNASVLMRPRVDDFLSWCISVLSPSR